MKNRRNTWWFYFLVVVLLVGGYYAIVAVSTVDRCGRDVAKTWNWVPPKWECGPRF